MAPVDVGEVIHGLTRWPAPGPRSASRVRSPRSGQDGRRCRDGRNPRPGMAGRRSRGGALQQLGEDVIPASLGDSVAGRGDAQSRLALDPSSGSSRSGLLDQGDMCGRLCERAPAHVQLWVQGVIIISHDPLLICARGT
jgi:hypothetical protein